MMLTVSSYINKLHVEAMFLVMGTQNDYDYAYITYNKSKLRGFQRKSISKYNVQAWANIPITENGIVDMRLFVGRFTYFRHIRAEKCIALEHTPYRFSMVKG